MDFLRHLRAVALLTLVATCCGCASSGPKHEELKDSIPAIEAGRGRIFFYREPWALGAALQPQIWLNAKSWADLFRAVFFTSTVRRARTR